MKKRLYNCLKENEFNLDIKNDKFLNITYEIYHTFFMNKQDIQIIQLE